MGEPNRPRFGKRSGWAILLAVVLVAAVFVVHEDFGITWDESVQARYGELALDYFLSAGEEKGALDYLNLKYYGPAYELLPALVYRSAGLDRFETRHLVSALLALLALPGVYLVGRRLDGGLAGGLAVLALLAMPRFVGHAFNNSKDIPLAVAVVWFMLASMRTFARGDLRWRWVLVTALGLGAALWARPGAFPLLAAWLVVARLAGLALGGSPAEASGAGMSGAGRLKPGVAAAAVLALGWLLMIAPWPWAHGNPVVHPIIAMSAAARFPTEFPVLFGGEMYSLTELPRRYAPQYLAITTPLGSLALALLGGVLVAGRVARPTASGSRAESGVLLAWLLLPLAAVTLLRPHLYDGIRHLLFLLPGVAVLAGLAGAWLIRRLPTARSRAAGTGAVLLLMLSALPWMARLHPYQTTFFNALVGGTSGAAGSYELDYWAASYTEAMRWINRDSRTVARPVRVLVAGSDFLDPAMRHVAAPGVEPFTAYVDSLTPPPRNVEYYLALHRWGQERAFPEAPVVHTVGRAGATFAVVKRLAGPGASRVQGKQDRVAERESPNETARTRSRPAQPARPNRDAVESR